MNVRVSLLSLLSTCVLFAPVHSQELSKVLQYAEEGVYWDEGRQIKRFGNGYLIMGATYCVDDPGNEYMEYCIGLMKVDAEGQIEWRKIYDGGEDTIILARRQATQHMIIDKDTIYMISQVIKNADRGLRLWKLDANGDVLRTNDYFIPDTAVYYYGFIMHKGKLLIYIVPKYLRNLRPSSRIKIHFGNKLYVLEATKELEFTNRYYIGASKSNLRVVAALSASKGFTYVMYNVDVGMDSRSAYKKLAVLLKIGDDYNVERRVLIGDTFRYECAIDLNAYIIELEDRSIIVKWYKNLYRDKPIDTFPYNCANVIYKLDSNLNEQWEYTFIHRSEKLVRGKGLINLGDETIIGVGQSTFYYDRDLYDNSVYSGWCFQLTTDGELVWEKYVIDTSYRSGCFFDAINKDRGYIVVGVHFKNREINSADVWFFTLDEGGCWNGSCGPQIVIVDDSTTLQTANRDLEHLERELQIYPNPASGELTVEIDEELIRKPIKMELITERGETLLRSTITAPKSIWNVRSMADGVYYIRCMAGGKIAWKKVIIQH